MHGSRVKAGAAEPSGDALRLLSGMLPYHDRQPHLRHEIAYDPSRLELPHPI